MSSVPERELIRRDYVPDPDTLSVTVKDGIVTIAGKPETTEDGHDMVAAVRRMEGVVAVRDRLSYPAGEREPGSAGEFQG